MEKSGWYDDATYFNEKTQIIPTFYPLKESVCQTLWQGHKMVWPGLVDFKINAPKEILNGMVGDGSDSEFVQKISKTFMKGGEE